MRLQFFFTIFSKANVLSQFHTLHGMTPLLPILYVGCIAMFLFVSTNSSAVKSIAGVLDISLVGNKYGVISRYRPRAALRSTRPTPPALMNYTMNSHLNTEKSF